jgi:uncharacterized membrane protein YhfC
LVSTSTFAAIIISLLIAVGTPVALLIIFKKKFHISLKVLAVGALTFILFAQILEGLAHSFFLVANETTKSLLENPWLFMVYGGLMAGVFEETGRFVMMKYALKKHREWRDGLSFGLGHGGIEALVIVGVNAVMMLVFSMMMNNGTIDAIMEGPSAESLAPLIEQLKNGSFILIMFGGVERLFALAIHIGLSIFVLYGIKQGKSIYLLYAILLHAIIDFPAALYQKGMLPIAAVELLLFIIAAGTVAWIVKSKALFQRT